MLHMLLYQTLAFTIHGKILKTHQKVNLKYEFRYKIKNLNYLMDHILYHKLKKILNIH